MLEMELEKGQRPEDKMILAKSNPVPEEPFGPWMLVTKPEKARIFRIGEQNDGNRTSTILKKGSRKDDRLASSSRFTALAELDLEEEKERNMRTIMRREMEISDRAKKKSVEEGELIGKKTLMVASRSAKPRMNGERQLKVKHRSYRPGQNKEKLRPNLENNARPNMGVNCKELVLYEPSQQNEVDNIIPKKQRLHHVVSGNMSLIPNRLVLQAGEKSNVKGHGKSRTEEAIRIQNYSTPALLENDDLLDDDMILHTQPLDKRLISSC